MAIGESVVSAYSGPADSDAFGLEYAPPKEKTHKIQYSTEQKELHKQYGLVREVREGQKPKSTLFEVWNYMQHNGFEDWLLPLEMLEIIANDDKQGAFAEELRNYLNRLEQKPLLTKLIRRGLNLVDAKN